MIFVPKGVSISLINSIEDVKPDDSYNFYHILKVKEKENINFKNINIKDILEGDNSKENLVNISGSVIIN